MDEPFENLKLLYICFSFVKRCENNLMVIILSVAKVLINPSSLLIKLAHLRIVTILKRASSLNRDLRLGLNAKPEI